MSSNANRSHTNPSHITFLTDQAKTDHQEAVSNAMSGLQSSGSDATLSSVQQVGNYSWNGTNWERTQVDASGSLKVNVVSSSAGGDASASNQLTMISHLSQIETDSTSMNSKITACDTGSVSVSSSVLPTGASSSANQAVGNAHLNTIAGDTTSLDSKIISGTDHTITGSGRQQVFCYGLDNNNDLHALHLNNTGDLNIEISELGVKGQTTSALSFPVVIASDNVVDMKQKQSENVGSRNNLANNVSIAPAGVSSVVDVSNMRNANIIYEDSSTSSYDGLEIDISVDGGVNYHEAFSTLYPYTNSAGTKRVATYMNLNLGGITNLRLRNTSSIDTYTNVNASVVGCP